MSDCTIRLRLIVATVLTLCVGYSNGDLTLNCLKCICKVEGCESRIGQCNMDKGSLSCGPYQIKKNYWTDCGSPGGDWQTCTKQMACSETCVRAYMRRYAQRCTGRKTPTCQDYARIHNGGPSGCHKQQTLGYWKKVQDCCKTKCDSNK
jgi:hypothetical protein